MKIRSITFFTNPGWPLEANALSQAGAFIAAARPAFETAGYEVQTSRLATVPFPRMLTSWNPEAAINLAGALEEAAAEQGFAYVSLGPALPDFPGSYAVIPDILAATSNVFLGGVMATPEMGVSLPAVRACAEVIHRAAALDPNGFGNLYFAALANVPAGAPFFPAAYHDGRGPCFALAIEAADLAVQAVSEAPDLGAARQTLTALVQKHGRALSRVSQELAAQFDLVFGGIDFSLAPYPRAESSIGAAIEGLGVPAVGLHGSLAAAAFLTSALDQAVLPRAGFSGLFLPLLEDAALAARGAEGTLTVTDLLLYSAVCGTGLDTIPLPGDTTPDELAPVLLDLAALALRLDKPLTARLMPIPGKQAGDPTDFAFEYFANSRVLALRTAPLSGHLAGDGRFRLSRRG
jgi:uncharacterized protein (UPF0210 family)